MPVVRAWKQKTDGQMKAVLSFSFQTPSCWSLDVMKAAHAQECALIKELGEQSPAAVIREGALELNI